MSLTWSAVIGHYRRSSVLKAFLQLLITYCASEVARTNERCDLRDTEPVSMTISGVIFHSLMPNKNGIEVTGTATGTSCIAIVLIMTCE